MFRYKVITKFKIWNYVMITTSVLASATLVFSFLFPRTDVAYAAVLPEQNYTSGDSKISFSISGDVTAMVEANRGETSYREHAVKISGTNVRSYNLAVSGDTVLKYQGVCTDTEHIPCSLVSANNAVGNVPQGTWGYGWDATGKTKDKISYTAPPVSGSANVDGNAGVKGQLDVSGKLVFAANFKPDQLAGNYTGEVKLLLTVTPQVLITYNLTYDANANNDNTVAGIPDGGTDSGYDKWTSKTFNTGAAPTRTGYTFEGWAEKSDGDVVYKANTSFTLTTSDDAVENTIINKTLYAKWRIDSYTCKKQYRLEKADGTWEDYRSDGTEQIEFGKTCTYSKTITNYKNTANGTNGAQASTSGTMGVGGLTLSLSFYRDTYTLTVNRNNTTYLSVASASTSPVHGSNYYRWNQVVNISATANTGYTFVNWTTNSGGSFANAKSASTTYTMPIANATVTANGNIASMQDFTCSSLASGAKTTLIDSRDGSKYEVQKLGDGKCWMISNLTLDLTVPGIVATDNSDNNTGKNYPNASTSNSSVSVVQDAWKTTTSPTWTNSESLQQFSKAPKKVSSGNYRTNYGYYYSYCAATIGTCTNSGNASSSICPKGWKLPSLSDLTNAVGTTVGTYVAGSSDVDGYMNITNKGVTSKWYATGYVDASGIGYGGVYGYVWTSTGYTGVLAYRLLFSDVTLGVSPNNMYFGFPVRCVKSS